ncbi:MAG: dihydroorotate dehydrogenase [Arenicella sp.]|jgi:dihydroorotate dehydrogenase
MYSILVKPILFSLDPEQAHDLTLHKMQLASKQQFLLKLIEKLFGSKVPALPVTCMGIEFANPVGLAAGLDKDACALPAFSALGFAGVELGTVTPKPQDGNAKPRMFRLLEDKGLINRMGFNSCGVDQFLLNLKPTEKSAVAGINIGKNAVTSIEDAHFDYVSALQRVYSRADYITVNISSPNTKSLRDLQNADFLDNLLLKIKQTQKKCEKVHKRYVPIALKVAPDLDSDEIETIAELLISHKFDGLIASNTTIDRPSNLQSKYAAEGGGLSGSPVKGKSTECIRQFYKILKGHVQIIGVGGIANADDAWEKMLAGADFLQIYSLFIYQGPTMIADIVKGLQLKLDEHGYDDIATAMAALRES